MGEEFYNKGTNIQEGPGINIARIPQNGRTFEYISGEDPVLGGTLVKQVRWREHNRVGCDDMNSSSVA